MNKLEHIAEVIRLYDEIDDLKRAKVGAELEGVEEPPVAQRGLSPMDLIAIAEGKKHLFKEYFDCWRYKSYGPKVYDVDGRMTEENIKTFDEYFDSIKPSAFDTDYMLTMFEEGDISFKEFKEYFKEDIRSIYEELVLERLERVAMKNEDVRATEE